MSSLKNHVYLLLIFLLAADKSYSSVGEHPAIPERQNPKIALTVTPDKKDWTYKLGEEVIFQVAFSGNDSLLRNASVNYQIGLEKMAPRKTGTLKLEKNGSSIRGGTLNSPGFLRCKVSVDVHGKIYEAIATAAFEPEKIKPTAVMPADFISFWKQSIAESRKIPLDVKLTPLKRKSETVNIYQVEYTYSQKGDRFYGVLCIPKKAGKYPAIIRFPGAGVRPLGGDVKTAEKGFITLDLNIHSVPVNQARTFYDSLQNGRLVKYQYQGLMHRDSSYYKNAIIGCVRSVDMIYSLPEFNGKSVGAWGSSQGGALSIITTSLEPRIKYLVALCPALSDITGYLHDRAGGWPHIFSKENSAKYDKPEVKETVGYYDVVNFARGLKVPGFYSWGFNDQTTPPTSFYSAYNSIAASKQVFIVPHGEHKIYPEQRDKAYAWLMQNLLR